MKGNKFYLWLRENTNLMESSIRLYYYTIERFKREYKEVNIENINKFISENTREKRNSHYKFAILKYLEFLQIDNLQPHITKLKNVPRKKIGNYYDKKTILELIEKIEGYYRPVALIQYLSGARAREVLSFHRSRLIKEGDHLRLVFLAKGGKEKGVYIPAIYSEKIWKIIEARNTEYPFLKGKNKDFITWVNNNYRYYLRQLRKAAEEMNITFSTHDFRRNFAREIYRLSGKKMSVVKYALRHKRIETTEKYIGELVSQEEFENLLNERVVE
jgi:integrase